MPTDFTPIALDIETSTASATDGLLLSFAMLVHATGESHSFDVRWLEIPEGSRIDPRAMEINQIPVDFLGSPTRRTLEEIEEELVPWIEHWRERKKRRNRPIAMGLNVGGFDLPFLAKFLPSLLESLTDPVPVRGPFPYQCIDLNSLFFAAATQRRCSFWDMRRGVEQEAMEQVRKIYPGFVKHDALSDCYYNCAVFEVLTGWKFGEERL